MVIPDSTPLGLVRERRRRRRFALLLAAIGLASAACDPGASLSVDNQTQQTIVVSYREGTYGRAFAVAPGQRASLLTITGGARGQVFVFVSGTCARVADAIGVPEYGDSLITLHGDGTTGVSELDRSALAAMPGVEKLPSDPCAESVPGATPAS